MKWVLFFAITVFLVSCVAGPKVYDEASLSAEWGKPERLSINSAGTEDGAYVAPDGNTLFFVYASWDPLRAPAVSVHGPSRDPNGACKSSCGDFPRADLFYSTRDAQGAWQEPRIHPLTVKKPVGGIILARPDRAYLMHQFRDGDREDIAVAAKTGNDWGEPSILEAVNSSYTEADPWVDSNEMELFFWSDRPASLGKKNIWHSVKSAGLWQAPQLLPEPINSGENDMQPFLFGDVLYFASDRSGGVLKIYRSTRSGSVWSTPAIVVESKYGVGEPTLTADGKTLYFVQVFQSEKTFLFFKELDFDIDILCATLK